MYPFGKQKQTTDLGLTNKSFKWSKQADSK